MAPSISRCRWCHWSISRVCRGWLLSEIDRVGLTRAPVSSFIRGKHLNFSLKMERVWIRLDLFRIEVSKSTYSMPSSPVIRGQQRPPSPLLAHNNSEIHTISMFRLSLRLINYLYLFNAKLVAYFLFHFKRLIRFVFSLWSYAFIAIRGSKDKVESFVASTLFRRLLLFCLSLVDSISIC